MTLTNRGGAAAGVRRDIDETPDSGRADELNSSTRSSPYTQSHRPSRCHLPRHRRPSVCLSRLRASRSRRQTSSHVSHTPAHTRTRDAPEHAGKNIAQQTISRKPHCVRLLESGHRSATIHALQHRVKLCGARAFQEQMRRCSTLSSGAEQHTTGGESMCLRLRAALQHAGALGSVCTRCDPGTASVHVDERMQPVHTLLMRLVHLLVRPLGCPKGRTQRTRLVGNRGVGVCVRVRGRCACGWVGVGEWG